MKKVIVVAIGMLSCVGAFAQRANINSANNSLKYKEYKKALEYINEAVADLSTKDDPKAWFVRGTIYMEMQQDPGYAAEEPYVKGIESFLKVVELKSNYQADVVNGFLLFGFDRYYAAAVEAYNSKDYPKAYEKAAEGLKVVNIEDGKRFNNPKLPASIVGLKYIQALSAYYNKEYTKAEPILLDLKDNPVENKADYFGLLADIYRTNGQGQKEIAIVDEGRKKHPGDKSLRIAEVNYYITNNMPDVLLKKLEEAVASEPDNAAFHYQLAKASFDLAFPQNSSTKPDNFDMLLKNSEEGYKKALELDGGNAGYNYDMAVLYYNQTIAINEKMNAITGTSAEDDKKWNALKEERNVLFNKALPYLTKVYDMLDPKASELKPDDMFLYKSSLIALNEIYVKQDKLQEAKVFRDKLSSLK
ncbi:MAG: hypothetical protein H6551_12420 [Chitinophagales bacterium]|nr:hypothetical protein [Chitinophagaceae bacterium]MCB9065935.1 hypothetical protein [Chitinophagales bacterium]